MKFKRVIIIEIIQKNFSNDLTPIKDNLLDYMHVLLKFVKCRIEKISFSAVTLIQLCISSLVKAHIEKKKQEEEITPTTSDSPISLNYRVKVGEAADDDISEEQITSYYGISQGRITSFFI